MNLVRDTIPDFGSIGNMGVIFSKKNTTSPWKESMGLLGECFPKKVKGILTWGTFFQIGWTTFTITLPLRSQILKNLEHPNFSDHTFKMRVNFYYKTFFRCLESSSQTEIPSENPSLFLCGFVCLCFFNSVPQVSKFVACNCWLSSNPRSTICVIRSGPPPPQHATRQFRRQPKKKTTHDDPRWPAWDCRKGTFQLKHIWKLQKRPMNLIIWLHNFYAFGHPSNRNHPKAWSFQPQFLFGTGKELRKRKTETRNSYW